MRLKVGNDGKSQAIFIEKSKNRQNTEFIHVTYQELQNHQSDKDAWVVVNNIVYDLTYYLECHPGGKDILLPHLGKDVTDLFNKYHHWVNAQILLKNWIIGGLKN